MKVTTLQENLARGLQIAGRAVSTRGSLPILSNVLLRTENGRLKLTATNLEVGINVWVPAKVDDEGGITVPAKLFTDFVNSLPPGPAELSLNVRTKTVHLRSGPYEANFKGMDAEEFPIIPAAPEKPTRCSRSPQLAHAPSCGARPAASSSFSRKASAADRSVEGSPA